MSDEDCRREEGKGCVSGVGAQVRVEAEAGLHVARGVRIHIHVHVLIRAAGSMGGVKGENEEGEYWRKSREAGTNRERASRFRE